MVFTYVKNITIWHWILIYTYNNPNVNLIPKYAFICIKTWNTSNNLKIVKLFSYAKYATKMFGFNMFVLRN